MDRSRVLFRMSPLGALKTGRCSGFDAWIVPAFCSGSSPHRALKTRRCSGLDMWILTAFCSGSSPRGALKTKDGSALSLRLSLRSVPDRPRIEPKKWGGVQNRIHIVGLVFLSRESGCLSVCLRHRKTPTSRGQQSFWSKAYC